MGRIHVKSLNFDGYRAILGNLALLVAMGAECPALACGVYEVTGQVRATDREVRLVVAEGTQSQAVFSTKSAFGQSLLIGFKDQFVKARVVIGRAMNGTEGVFDSIESVVPAAPDLIHGASAQWIVQKKKAVCRKA